MMKHTSEVLKDWVERTLEDGRGVTKWERYFLESLAEQLSTRGTLSEKQQEILERIYAEKTS